MERSQGRVKRVRLGSRIRAVGIVAKDDFYWLTPESSANMTIQGRVELTLAKSLKVGRV